MTHVSSPGCYCTDCVENPSARITGDKDRENPVEGAPLQQEAVRGWLALGAQASPMMRKSALEVFDQLKTERDSYRDALDFGGHETERLRTVLRYIADVGYVNHKSGNENFEYLQRIARDGLRAKPEVNHD